MSPARRKKYPTAAELARGFAHRNLGGMLPRPREAFVRRLAALLRRYALLVPQIGDAWNEMRLELDKTKDLLARHYDDATKARALLADCAAMLEQHYSDASAEGDPPRYQPNKAMSMATRIRDYLEGR